MREFKVAAKEATDIQEVLPSGKPITFKINNREVTASPPPNSGPFAYLTAMQAQDADPSDTAYAMLQFITSLMSDTDASFVRNSLAVGELDFSTLGDVFTWLVEEWSARPTTSPRGSSSRRRTTGHASTEPQPSME